MVKRFHPDSAQSTGSPLMFTTVVDAYKTILSRIGTSKTRSPFTGNSFGGGVTHKPGAFDRLFGFGRLLVSNTHPDVKINAARRIGESGKKSAWVFLRKALRDQDERVVTEVVAAVRKLRIHQSVHELSALFLRTGAEVKQEILTTINALGYKKILFRLIIMAMEDTSQTLRREAVKLYFKNK